jgi:tetratricopeptide (TPR) repeat protein
MNIKTLTLYTLLIFTQLIFSQSSFNQPKDIYTILEKSNNTYVLEDLPHIVLPTDRSKHVTHNVYFRTIDSLGIHTNTYSISKETHHLLKDAEKLFSKRKYKSARNKYIKALKRDSSLYYLMTYIGQTYETNDNLEEAVKWYQKTIDLNIIDYMAHWFLADAYIDLNKDSVALDLITLALILNRNNPRIKKSFKNIYKINKLKAPSWEFIPQINIDSLEDNKIKIGFNQNWIGYALTKALWKYEPGYPESHGISKGALTSFEERECIANLLATIKEEALKQFPEFIALNKAVELGFVEEFIMFEIILPDYPTVAYQFSKDFLYRIKDYVQIVRGGKTDK